MRCHARELACSQIVRMAFPGTPSTYFGLLFETILCVGAPEYGHDVANFFLTEGTVSDEGQGERKSHLGNSTTEKRPERRGPRAEGTGRIHFPQCIRRRL